MIEILIEDQTKHVNKKKVILACPTIILGTRGPGATSLT
jgi:hypothetical protein